MRSSRPGSSTSRTSSPSSITVSAFGTKPLPWRRIEMIRLPSGRAISLTRWPMTGEPSGTSTSMISSCSSRRSSRCTVPYEGTSCSISRRIRSVALTAGWMPSSSKYCRFRGLLTRAMIRSQRYFSFASWQISRLSSSSPVTAIVRSARLMPARSSTHSSVASPYWMACSSSCSTVRYRERSLSMTVTSWRLVMSSRARFQPTLPAPAMTTYMGLHLLERALEHLDRVARRADRVQALFGVPLRARGIHHTHDDTRHLVVLRRDLADRQVRVVAVGRGDEHVGLLDAGLAEGVDLEPVPEREPPARVLPRRVHAGVEALVRQRVLVEHRDLVALGE